MVFDGDISLFNEMADILEHFLLNGYALPDKQEYDSIIRMYTPVRFEVVHVPDYYGKAVDFVELYNIDGGNLGDLFAGELISSTDIPEMCEFLIQQGKKGKQDVGI
jgi:hypothetical protein